MAFAAFSTSMDKLTLQRMHAATFRFLGGVPCEVLYDNLRTVTIGRDEHFKPVLMEEFVTTRSSMRPPGCGKTRLSISLGHAAFTAGEMVHFTTARNLFRKLRSSGGHIRRLTASRASASTDV